MTTVTTDSDPRALIAQIASDRPLPGSPSKQLDALLKLQAQLQGNNLDYDVASSGLDKKELSSKIREISVGLMKQRSPLPTSPPSVRIHNRNEITTTTPPVKETFNTCSSLKTLLNWKNMAVPM